WDDLVYVEIEHVETGSTEIGGLAISTHFQLNKMETKSENTIVATGGATGIGLALATRFLRDGNVVIIVGRVLINLPKPKQLILVLRLSSFQTLISTYPDINVFVHNVGVQRAVNVSKGVSPDWATIESEININYAGVVHMTLLSIPHLLKKKSSAIITVTIPEYSSTKAALHLFTSSLRHQLLGTPIRVIEIIPPAVDTDVQAPGLHKFGVNVDVFAHSILKVCIVETLRLGIVLRKNVDWNSVGRLVQHLNN
ncbi:short-chain dehydrogenase/reductase SDR, partial [Thraustotheca clavata]